MYSEASILERICLADAQTLAASCCSFTCLSVLLPALSAIEGLTTVAYPLDPTVPAATQRECRRARASEALAIRQKAGTPVSPKSTTPCLRHQHPWSRVGRGQAASEPA